MKEINLSSKKFIVITGLTRSGKTALSPIISSLRKCEQFFLSTPSENLLALNFLKKINFQLSKNIIRRILNEQVADKIYGRNLNLRNEDYSCIKNYNGEIDYNKRAKQEKSREYTKKILKLNNFPILFHEGLVNLNLLNESLNNPKIVNISRHPVDIIKSWKKKNYIDKFFESEESNVITYQYKNIILPFFLKGSEVEIKKCKSNEDKILMMQHNLKKIFKKNYENSSKKRNILLLKFDDLILKPDKVIKIVCKKFKLKTSLKTKKTFRQQRCPRKINFNERTNNQKEISKKLSPYFRNLFEKMIFEYENNYRTF